MARSAQTDFNEWIANNNIPDSVQEYLINSDYNTVDMLQYLRPEIIDQSNLTAEDKVIIKNALEENPTDEFEEWCDGNGLSKSLKKFLLRKGIDSIIKFRNITLEDVKNFTELDVADKDALREIVELHVDSDDISDPTQNLSIESLKWKEFGRLKFYKKWDKYFYPVEMFCPDGFWAWNSSAKSLLFGNLDSSQVWNRFDDNKPGWIMSPPVLLPDAVGPFKISLSLRVIPKVLDDAPILQLVLLNDIYNKRLLNFFKIPKVLTMVFKFRNLINGLETGQPIIKEICFQELHDNCDIEIPGNIRALKSPPIIVVQVLIK